MTQDDGLGGLLRKLKQFEAMMAIASRLKDKEIDELDFWTLKREAWMGRTLARFETVWLDLRERYQNHSVFVPDFVLLDAWELAEKLAPRIGDFAARNDWLVRTRMEELSCFAHPAMVAAQSLGKH